MMILGKNRLELNVVILFKSKFKVECIKSSWNSENVGCKQT